MRRGEKINALSHAQRDGAQEDGVVLSARLAVVMVRGEGKTEQRSRDEQAGDDVQALVVAKVEKAAEGEC